MSHFDLYRLETPEDIVELGWEDALSEGIVLVEWPERLQGSAFLPETCLQIEISLGEFPEERVFQISPERV